jgi:tetratricopeptide (TPR) repeat protein
MVLRRPFVIKLLGPLLAFALTMTVVVMIDRSSSPSSVSTSGPDFAAARRSTDALIKAVRTAIAANPRQADGYTRLGNAYLQKVRESADSSYYPRIDAAFKRALALKPGDPGALAGLGALALGRHHFEEGLSYGLKARRAAPGVARIYGVIVDANIELGRYGAAAQALQRMVDLKPNLPSYARVSYFRELHGDLPGALEAMRLAVSAGGEAPENAAYVQTLLGNLELQFGRTATAERAYREAIARYPGYAPANVGLAHVEAARGHLGAAIRRYRATVARVKVPEYLIALGEAELAAGQRSAARRHLAASAAQEAKARRYGENTNTEAALYEASHGDPGRAVVLGRRAWARSPSVRAADALGWALTRAGHPAQGLSYATRALKLGSRDPLFLYHAGVSASLSGHPGLGRHYLSRSLALNPHFSPFWAPRARKLLDRLS